MKPTLEEDLRRLALAAFQREAKVRDLICQYHEILDSIRRHPDFSLWEKYYPWLFTPLALWPIDLDGLGRHLLGLLKRQRRFDQRLVRVISWLGSPPLERACNAVVAHEQAVRNGNYESLVLAQHKFDNREKQLRTDPEFRADWLEVKGRFDVIEFQNSRGVIRRRMVQERNFRSEWDFRWRSRAEQFSAVFDVFCYRWHLYGMEYDTPLLLKLSVNITPHGTLLMIPRYWSFDPDRDLNWKEITRLHKSRGVQRQGPKLSSNMEQLASEARRAQASVAEAKRKGLRGQRLFNWVADTMKWPPGTDPSKLRRLLKVRT